MSERASIKRTFRRGARLSSRMADLARAAARASKREALRNAPVYAPPGELKAVDTTINSAIDSTGYVHLLNGIARGDDINERNGRQVLMKSVQISWLSFATAATGVDQVHRVVLVYDRQANATALTWNDVFGSSSIHYPRNLENRKRFKILMDQSYVINAAGEPGTGRVEKFYRKLAHPVTFNAGDAGTIADITTGSLYLMWTSSVGAGATAGTIQGRARVRYSDQ